MAALWAWFTGTKIGGYVAAAGAAIALLAAFYLKAYADGKAKQQAKDNEQTLENLRARNKTDAVIDALSDTNRRHHLREWVPDDK